MRRMHQAAADVRARPLVEQGLTGLALAETLQQQRLVAITEARREFKTRRHPRPADFPARPPVQDAIPIPSS
jgi:tRNA nucleotidyltransferase (CCA-adding enzyme)